MVDVKKKLTNTSGGGSLGRACSHARFALWSCEAMTSEKRKERRELRHMLHPKNGHKSEHANKGSWQPGQSGNPAGRKPGPTFSSILREALTRKRRYKDKDGNKFTSTELELIVDRAVRELRTNPDFDVKLLSVFLDRLDGKVKEPVEHSMEGGGPLFIGVMSDEQLLKIAGA